MSIATSRHVWERWDHVWHVLFYAVLLLTGLLALDPATQPRLPVIVIGMLALGGWYAIHLSPATWRLIRDQPVRVALYLALGWAIWYALTLSHAAALILLCALAPQAFLYLRFPYSLVALIILNSLTLLLLNQINPALIATWMLLIALSTGGAALLGFFITQLIRQSEQRQALIAALEAARTHLAEREREAGRLHERERLAGELHDTITQGLIGIVRLLEAAEDSAQPEDQRLHLIQVARATARANLAEARRFIWELRPPLLEQGNLAQALQHHLTAWSQSNHIPVELVISPAVDSIAEPIQIALLRVTQEALANVAKHAHASRVTVTLSLMPDALVLDVNDDGAGFNPSATPEGFGIGNMRRRLRQVGGTLTVESAPAEGTTIMAEIPLQESGHESHPHPDR